MTQEELAHECGWTQSRIANYESEDPKNRRVPRGKDPQKLAAALNVSVSELMYGSSEHAVTQAELTALQTLVVELTRTVVANTLGADHALEALLAPLCGGNGSLAADNVVQQVRKIASQGQHKAALDVQHASQPASARTAK